MGALQESIDIRARWPALGILLLSLVANPLSSATFTVSKTEDTNDGVCDADCSLREGVIAANALAGVDKIDLPAGAYRLSISGRYEDAAATGDLDITDHLTLSGAGADISTIDADKIGRVLHILISATVRLEGVSIVNGSAGGDGGGVLHASTGDLAIVDSTIADNRAGSGAGIASVAGSGTLTITDSVIRGNATISGGSGGGIFNHGQALLTRVNVTANQAYYWDLDCGGVACYSGTGGGISHGGGKLTLIDSSVLSNSAGDDGGGISGADVTLVNVTAAGNSASGYLFPTDAQCSISADLIVNSTIVHNTGGICGTAPEVHNSILALNENALYWRENCPGSGVDGSYNLISDDSCGFTGPGNLHNTDPRLADRNYYGGPTATYALLADSPAIDAADASQCPAEDQRGVSRPQGRGCDIGAFESRQPWKEDVVASFDIFGLFSRMNDAAWLHIGNTNPDQVAVGDIDANGQHDVIGVFPSGIFIKRNLRGWEQLHGGIPETMAIGDLNYNPRDDLVFAFGSLGLWAWLNDERWLRLHTVSPEHVVVANVDRIGLGDVIGVFSDGIFAKLNLGGWVHLHNDVPERIIGGTELIVDFGWKGLLLLRGTYPPTIQNDWRQLHNGDAGLVATGDIDGNGSLDVVATFRGFDGLFVLPDAAWTPRGTWRQISNFAPDRIAMADMDGNGQDDVIGDFRSTLTGLFVKRNDGPWEKLNNSGTRTLAGGDLDGT